MVEIFEYLNYREFLKDYIDEKRVKDQSFTHREILAKMGVSSTGFLSNVFSGKKNLNSKHVEDLSLILELNQRQRICFTYMVNFNQAKTIEEKKSWFDRLCAMKQVKTKLLENHQLSLFSRWYYVYIRDLLNFYTFSDDYYDLARRLYPPITEPEAKRAITALSEMSLIEKDQEGNWRPADAVVSTGDEVYSVQLADFQLKTMDFAKRALEKVPAKRRDISVLSMTLSKEKFAQVKREIQDFRKRLLNIANSDDEPDQVYQCNLQFFPVTRDYEGEI